MYLSTREREAGRGEVQNRSWLLSEFKDSLGYIRGMVVLKNSNRPTCLYGCVELVTAFFILG